MTTETTNTNTAGDTRAVLQTVGIGKEFNGVWVLRDINFELVAGEIHTLVGENGAGKSTFIKLLAGVHQPSAGTIWMDGGEVTIANARDSETRGIRTVHQEINLVPFFTVYKNIFMGDEKKKRVAGISFIDDKEMKRKAAEVIRELGVELEVTTPAHLLDASMERIVQISKVLVHRPKVLILDEPTTSLSEEERKRLLQIIKGLKKAGMGIVFITHNIEEVMEISDRVTVFRDGLNIGTLSREEASAEKIVAMMLGHTSFNVYKRGDCSACTDVYLELKGLCTDRLKDMSFALHKGEILGIAGVVGAGKSEIARAVFGLDRIHGGDIFLFDKKYGPSPRNAISHGIALVPEERQAQGLIPPFSVMKNITLTYLSKFGRGGMIDTDKESEVANRYIDLMSIKTTGASQIVKYLSGGNQQKVILSRWLLGDFSIGIFDEPTKGIDVKAKEDIYALIDQLAIKGKAILFLSSYLPELLNLCDRILVVHGGTILGEFDPKVENAREMIMHAMLGWKAAS